MEWASRGDEVATAGFDARAAGRKLGLDAETAERLWREVERDPARLLAAVPSRWVIEQFERRARRASEEQPAPGRRPRATTRPEHASEQPGDVRIATRNNALRAALRGDVLDITHALALDPSGLEIVVNGRARARLASAGVRGLQEGARIYLHPDIVRPSDPETRYLLAHELVHAAQRKLPAAPGHSYRAAEAEATSLGMLYARSGVIARPQIGLAAHRVARDEPEAPEAKLLKDPPGVKRTINMFAGIYTPLAAGAQWVGGLDKKKQALAMVLKDLVGGSAYSVKLLEEMIVARGGLAQIDATGGLDGQATQAETISPFRVEGSMLLSIANWCKAPPRNLNVNLNADQIATLEAGIDAKDTWSRIQPELPPWVTEQIYSIYMGATQKTLLKKYGAAVRLSREKPDPANAKAADVVHAEVMKVVGPPIDAMEAVRKDKVLAKEGAYRALWNLPAIEGAAVEVAVANESNPAPTTQASWFLFEADLNRPLAKSAVGDAAARKQLLERFKTRLTTQGVPSDGDAIVHDGPVKGTRPPLESSMHSYPALEPPFFDTPKGGDREFIMNVEFPDVFEAFRGYVYKWELIHVPQNDVDQVTNTGDTLSTAGESHGQGSVLGSRLGRDAEYGSADIQRSLRYLEQNLGPAGIGAVTLASANAMLRMVGTVVKTFIETLTKPRYEKTMPFDKDGLFVVRCVAWPRPLENAVADRVPSVAWMPIWVRPAYDMSKLRAHLDQKMTAGTIDRLKEIEAKLADKALPPDERKTLEDEKKLIEGMLNAKGDGMLEQEKKNLQASQATADAAQKTAIAKRIAEIDKILEMRKGRLADAKTDGSLEGVTRIPAAFVGDDAQSIRPLFEVFQKPAAGATIHYHAVDSTTKNSGHRDGHGKTREDAISDAVKNILESDQGYGRGYVTLTIPAAPGSTPGAPPTSRTIRIEKSLGSLMAEAVDNLATVASIAAIAAAPFTGGASLALLVPIGIVGAIPSAYRLVDRGMQGTLRVDMATAMDVVNILGAAVGAGQASAAGKAALRGVPVGKGWMILGLGSDGLGMMVAGAGMLAEINELSKDPNMPQGLRNAMVAQIVGMQMVQLGLAVGAQLYMHGKTQQELHGGKKKVVEHGPIEPHLQEKFRSAVGGKGEAIAVYRDAAGTQVAGNGVEIHYDLDGYGLPTNLRVIAGPGAGEAEIMVHAKTAKVMTEYQGLVGYLRNLRDRVITLFKSGKLEPKPGSRAWEAKLELEVKLPKLVEQVYAELGSGKIKPEVADSRIKDIREQMLTHERALNELGDGHGFIAAHDGVTKKAEAAGYPKPPPDHYYFETEDGKFQLQRNVSSDAPPQHIEWKDGKPIIVPGAAPAKATALDVTAVRARSAAWLSVPADRVAVHVNPDLSHVSVRPPSTAGGGYEVHFPPGTSEAAVKAAVDKHLELAARRPKNIKDPYTVGPDGVKRRWTGSDEAAYLGRPEAAGDDHWALHDGKLRYVREDATDGHPKKYDEKKGTLVDDTEVRVEPSFEPGTTKADAFEILGGNDPKTEFGAWVAAAEKYLGVSKDTLIAQMKEPAVAGKELKHRTVRSDLKEPHNKKFVDKITDRDFLKKQYPHLYEGVTGDKALVDADRAASHQEMLKLTQELGSGDRGAFAERWYKKVYAPSATEHVTFTKEAMAKQGIQLQKDRVPDLADGKRLRDVKHVNGPLGADDKIQLEDFSNLVDRPIKVDGTTYQFESLVVSFTEPGGAVHNASYIADKVKLSDKISFEIFNRNGQRKVISQHTLADAGFNPGGTAASLADAIKAYAR